MASDVVQFLRKTIISSLENEESKLPGDLAEEFRKIKDFIKFEDANEAKKNFWSDPAASSSLLPYLNDLNEALAECSVFVEECQGLSGSFSRLNLLFHQTKFVREMKQKLKSLAKSLAEEIGKWTPNYGISRPRSMTLFPTGRHTSFDSNAYSHLIGFIEQEKQIEDLISDNGYKAIGIYGMGGSGKTALIHKVLNSPRVREQFSGFPIIWLCLSDIHCGKDADFEVNIVKFILCELRCDVDKSKTIDPSKVDLLKNLKDLLMSYKKYLIVFDDVWESNEFFSNFGDARADTVEDRLSGALPRDGGGKIIITSRLKEVVRSMVGEKNLIPMKGLDRESCRKILEDGIGFIRYVEEIEGLLNGSGGFMAIGIYGPTCSANTALVRKVLSTPSVREKFKQIWVRVPPISFNNIDEVSIHHVIRNDIVKCMLKKFECDVDELTKNNSDYGLLKIVKDRLESGKYLIVLADVQHKNYRNIMVDWGIVWQLLSDAWPNNGECTVIVTTEMKEVTQDLVNENNLVHVKLPELGANERSEDAIDGQYITNDIVTLCHDLPLAAKTIAKIIREMGH